MKLVFLILQIVTGIVLTTLILLQAKGTGLGRAFGGQTYHSRRGMEFIVFRFTIFLSVFFVVVSVVNQIFL